MFAVQCRVNGGIVDEEPCLTIIDAWDAIDRRRRALVAAGTAIVVEDPRHYIVARTRDTWVTVTIAGGASL